MMLSWKMAACIAAGNTVVIKPAQVSVSVYLCFNSFVYIFEFVFFFSTEGVSVDGSEICRANG